MGTWESVGKTDEWYTPEYIFDALECSFDLDVAHPKCSTSVPCDKFITENSLDVGWYGFIWMNPPYGGRNGLVPWLDKFFNHNNGIALTPDRTSAPWCQQALTRCDAVLFLNGKVKFIKPDGTTGNSPANGTCLFASGLRGVQALLVAEKNGLGVCFIRSEN